MKRLPIFLTLFAFFFSFLSCLDDDSRVEKNDFVGNFEAAWTAMDEHYCFFREKNIDWDKVYKAYQPYFRDSVKTIVQEFNLIGDMICLLRDGHVNLYSPFNTIRYWKWYEDYPINFDENLVSRYYLDGKQWIASGMQWRAFSDSIGYLRYSSFSTTPGETNIDYMLSSLSYCRGLIIDIRDNGGGALTNVTRIANRFATTKTLYGYISHKTGRGHDDFSEPEPMYLERDRERIFWDAAKRPVVVLTNRHTFSAANNFVQAMRALGETKTLYTDGSEYPKMIVTMGDRTGGGGGMPFETVLPSGWILRFSACPITDHKKRSTEEGIDPDFRVEMDSTAMFQLHRDDIIEAARQYIMENTRVKYESKK